VEGGDEVQKGHALHLKGRLVPSTSAVLPGGRAAGAAASARRRRRGALCSGRPRLCSLLSVHCSFPFILSASLCRHDAPQRAQPFCLPPDDSGVKTSLSGRADVAAAAVAGKRVVSTGATNGGPKASSFQSYGSKAAGRAKEVANNTEGFLAPWCSRPPVLRPDRKTGRLAESSFQRMHPLLNCFLARFGAGRASPRNNCSTCVWRAAGGSPLAAGQWFSECRRDRDAAHGGP
jgi:hypothetical protein